MSAAGDHLDLDAIAAFDEGLDDEPAHREHVDGCADCRHRLDQVRSARSLLADLPDEPMPADVADRIRAALPPESTVTTIIPAGSRRRRWSSPSLAGMGAAAAGVALIAAIAIGATRSSGNGGGSEAGSSAGAALPQSTAISPFPILSSGSRYTDGTLPNLAGTLDTLARRHAVPEPTNTEQQRAAGAGAAKDALSLSSSAPVPPALRALHDDRDLLLQCVSKLAGGPTRPVAVDFARFTGGLRHVKNAPAIVIVLPGLTPAANDVAFVVGPKCLTDPSQDLYTFQNSVG